MEGSQKRIAVAFLVGSVIVAGSFLISRHSTAHDISNTAAALTPVERVHITPADSDHNGLPDWQDSLIQSDPIELSSTSASYTAPTTVTGKFAVQFFEDYMRSQISGPFGQSQEELIQKSTEDLVSQAQDQFFTQKDIALFDATDSESLRAYGNQVANILLTQTHSSKDTELVILQDYMRYKKPERIHDLDPIESTYVTMVKEMLEIQVPSSYAKEHLDLTNALDAVREDIRSMQNVDTDALYTLLRVKRYHDDVLGLSNALKALFNTLYLQDNIRWSPDDPVLHLVTFTE